MEKTKINKEKLRKILSENEDVPDFKSLAEFLGVHENTMCNWNKTGWPEVWLTQLEMEVGITAAEIIEGEF
jgi:hypothetical protein